MAKLNQSAIGCYIKFWTRFAKVNGRATRAEYWHPFWINFLITSLLGIVSAGTLGSIFAVVLLIPTFTVTCRRLHDTSRTMILAILHHLSGIISTIGACLFILGIIYLIVNNDARLFGTATFAWLFGSAITSLIWLYTVIVLAMPGKKRPNRYGQGGSCPPMKDNEVVAE